eukprot:TRINITY_DN16257_c0_g1_i11.p1 TRINITY_DN16257_c0_g1~~TRINITY_DN16257_c0_g1_i11.p1  ORF type:complete len:547 (-),score=60.93 TRINITY_DN16257_c0_g1_i11:155-1795(-)
MKASQISGVAATALPGSAYLPRCFAAAVVISFCVLMPFNLLEVGSKKWQTISMATDVARQFPGRRMTEAGASHDWTVKKLVNENSAEKPSPQRQDDTAHGPEVAVREGEDGDKPDAKKNGHKATSEDGEKEAKHKGDSAASTRGEAQSDDREAADAYNDEGQKEDYHSTLSQAAHWTLGSIILVTCCTLCIGGCQCLCCLWACGVDGGAWRELAQDCLSWLSPYEVLHQQEAEGSQPINIERVLRREARLMVVCSLLPLLAAPWTTCKSGPPNWIYAMYIPTLIRCNVVEYKLVQALRVPNANKCTFTILVFSTLGALDHFDMFTDSLFPMQALACDGDIHDEYMLSIATSAVSIFTPIVGILHFWGLATVALITSTLAQQGTAVGAGPIPAACCAADVAGMGALAKHLEEPESVTGVSLTVIVVCIVKVLLENCVKLQLQISLLGLTWTKKTQLGRAKILGSVLLGLVTATLKALQALVQDIQGIYNAARSASVDKGVARTFLGAAAIMHVGIVLVVTASAAKLYYTFNCDSHVWNLTSGCVPVA